MQATTDGDPFFGQICLTEGWAAEHSPLRTFHLSLQVGNG
ncbi:hypothetical protein EV13_1279 [Prochlorococcus sp. MIT 0702]|nr:hypothetical protein EV12_2069 [Prochlorococcus sp. MIT 0701]KGG29125.1 hypothetical protein EV13_1279 [Prochlorococcus sp. MIT 0702]KGG32557.1 hypothetical protein EV14_2053 [Prochlorococcus sp. MIT 0703]